MMFFRDIKRNDITCIIFIRKKNLHNYVNFKQQHTTLFSEKNLEVGVSENKNLEKPTSSICSASLQLETPFTYFT